jgi:hypothetical protein
VKLEYELPTYADFSLDTVWSFRSLSRVQSVCTVHRTCVCFFVLCHRHRFNRVLCEIDPFEQSRVELTGAFF